MRKYYSMEQIGNEANINIYGDISSYSYEGSAPSAKALTAALEELTDVSKINVYINSYGGEVAEGLAIYNALKRHKAKIVTYCDGFAASIASVIFMAGDERIMNASSLLMIHNAWTFAQGNAEQLRKQADDLEKITQASVEAYKAHSTLTEEEIKTLMDNEEWITPKEALEYGFATAIEEAEKSVASQHAFSRIFELVKAQREKAADEEKPETDDEDGDGEEKPETENPADDGEDEEPNTDDEEDEEGEDNEANERMLKFFNAITKR